MVNKDKLLKEVTMMLSFDHPNVMSLIGMCLMERCPYSLCHSCLVAVCWILSLKTETISISQMELLIQKYEIFRETYFTRENMSA